MQKIMDRRLIKKWYPVMLLGAFIAITLGLTRSFSPPSPLPADVSSSLFSSGRALSDLSDLLKENLPHPSGSDANKVIRDRIVGKLKQRGLAVEIQSSFDCIAEERNCTFSENIVAVKKGRNSKSSIMLLSHYDSVPASPGAADDGYGVSAMLEIARILQQEPTYENDVVLLFTDAEELGLNGAVAFAEKNPLMDRVSVIINVEARGSSGQSTMFETGADNYNIIDVFQSAVSRPMANSLTYEVFKRMPNDTDYSVFKRKDIPGLNFASSSKASRYHSVIDDLQHIDQGTLQHHGSNALELLRSLGDENLKNIKMSSGDATYFDVFSVILVTWPSKVNVPLALICSLIIFIMLCMPQKESYGRDRKLIWSTANLVMVSAVVIIIPVLLSFPLGVWTELHPLDHLNPWPGKIAVWAGIIFGITIVSKMTCGSVDFPTQLLCNWLVIGFVSIILAFNLSGVAYISLAPLIAFMAGLLIDFVRSRFKINKVDYIFSAHMGFIVTAYMAIYHFHMLDVMFNFDLVYMKVIPFLFMGFALLPLLQVYYKKGGSSHRFHQICLGGVTVLGTIISMLIPAYSVDKPEPLNILYMEDGDNKKGFWVLENILAEDGGHSDSFVTMGFPGGIKEMSFPGIEDIYGTIKPAEYLSLPAPKFNVISDKIVEGRRVIEANLTAGQKGFELYIAESRVGAIASLKVNGQSTIHAMKTGEGAQMPFYISLGAAQDMTFNLEIIPRENLPFSLLISEASELIDTESSQALKSLRPKTANEIQKGDRTIVFKKIEL